MSKPDRVFLQMWGPTREHLIASHEFYVGEAKQRLLDPFTDESMAEDANAFAEAWLARIPFDPDRDDPTGHYEQSWDESVSFYQRLADLRDTTRLSIIAGMFHEWEKQVRDWLGRELGHHGFGKHAHGAVWSATLDDLFDLFEACGWNVRTLGFFAQLHRCQLVTNVYKHGNGRSFEALKAVAPDLIGNTDGLPAFFVSALDYSSLSVSDDDLARFAEAITSFWRELPENIFFSQVKEVPKWLERALRKEREEKR
ncbi:hypothetical protein [Erythrobacter sp. WG]|uniref:hypothetical protein n=1 Tax=Erythrobacter sp. WG TaxID=2985510 RepID=UPI00227165D9|nr:hypothetical protein [Erythrobacter sp. WG]MCX9145914.1 hypothetical protein [Erythrobacter sp. WG]